MVNDGPDLDIPSVDSAQFSNLGSTVQVFLDGSTTILGKSYSLLQYHFHTPSEHYINGEYFPLEMHLVNQADGKPFSLSYFFFSHEPLDQRLPSLLLSNTFIDGSLGVIGLLFEMSESTTPILANTIENLDEITEPGSSTTTGPLDFTELDAHLNANPLYTYSGSLTTPPCTEGVTFIISQAPLQIGIDAFNALKDVLKMNARPIQSPPGVKNLLELSCPVNQGNNDDDDDDDDDDN